MQVLPATQSDVAARHHELISARHSGHFTPESHSDFASIDTRSLTKPGSLLANPSGGSQDTFQSYSNLQSLQSGSQSLQVPGKQERWDNRVASWGSQAVSSLDGQVSSNAGFMRHTHQE